MKNHDHVLSIQVEDYGCPRDEDNGDMTWSKESIRECSCWRGEIKGGG